MCDKFLQFLGIAKKAHKIAQGYNKSEEFIKKRKVKLIIISNDISDVTLRKFNNYAKKYDIDIIKCYSSEILGAAIGAKQIGVISILDDGFRKKFMEIWNEKLSGGEIFGENKSI